MDFSLTREQEMLRNTVREFAETELAPNALALDEKGEFPSDIVKKMAQLGLVGIVTPKEYGGSDMGHLARMIAIEEVSRVYPPLGFFLQIGLVGMYILQASGNEEQKKNYLPPLAKGERIMATALTEPTGGSDPGAMQSTAKLDGDEYILNGRKVYISLVEVADLVCVVAKKDEKFSAFLVEKGTPGFEVTRRERHPGLRTVPVNEFALTDCRIPRTNLVGEEGRGLGAALTGIAAMGRTGAAGVGLGIAEGCYEAALKFAKERNLYGKPIAELQAIQFMLVDMNIEVQAAKWLCYEAGWLLDQGKGAREAANEIARAKVYACDLANRAALNAVQILGASGTTPEYHIVRRQRDALEMLAAAGTQQVMRVVIGGNIIR